MSKQQAKSLGNAESFSKICSRLEYKSLLRICTEPK